jgi:hypothetical protein
VASVAVVAQEGKPCHAPNTYLLWQVRQLLFLSGSLLPFSSINFYLQLRKKCVNMELKMQKSVSDEALGAYTQGINNLLLLFFLIISTLLYVVLEILWARYEK